MKIKCYKCGTEMNKSARFCPQCGTPSENLNLENTRARKQEKKRRKAFPATIAVIVLALAAIGVFVIFGSDKPRNDNPSSSMGSSTETTLAKMQEECEEVKAIVDNAEEPYRQSSGTLKEGSEERALSAVMETLKDKEDCSAIVSYREEDGAVIIELAAGLDYVYVPVVEGTLAGGSSAQDFSGSVSVYEPEYDESNADSFPYDFYKDVKELCSTTNSLNIEIVPNAGCDFMDAEAKSLAKASSKIAYSSNSCKKYNEVNLEAVESFGKDEIVLWEGHGYWTTTHGSFMWLNGNQSIGTLEISTKGSKEDQEKLTEKFKTRKLLCVNGGVAVTSSFISDYYGENGLDGSVFILTTCLSMADERLAQAFVDCGAKAVVGYTNSVNSNYALPMRDDLLYGMEEYNLTLSEAINYAKNLNGYSDPYNDDTSMKAYPEDAARDFRLKSGTTVIPSGKNVSVSAEKGSFNGHKYAVYDLGDGSTWAEAEAYCESIGGHLATIGSKEENDYVYSFITAQGYKSAYLGYYRTENSEKGLDGWAWVNYDGREDTTRYYVNWANGEPNNENGKENWAMFYYKFTDGGWNDGNFGQGTVGNDTAFICEWDEGQ